VSSAWTGCGSPDSGRTLITVPTWCMCLQDPNISRDFHANKLRDFVNQSDKVISVIKCQNQLRLLSLNMGDGGCCMLLVPISATQVWNFPVLSVPSRWWTHVPIALVVADGCCV
jgi:hypothetical protein